MRDELSILRFLGLAARAGKVVSGFDQVTASIENNDARLLLISSDISRNTLSKLLDTGSKEGIRMPCAYSFSTKYELGRAIGKPDRTLVAVTDDGFAQKLSAMLEEEYEEDNH